MGVDGEILLRQLGVVAHGLQFRDLGQVRWRLAQKFNRNVFYRRLVAGRLRQIGSAGLGLFKNQHLGNTFIIPYGSITKFSAQILGSVRRAHEILSIILCLDVRMAKAMCSHVGAGLCPAMISLTITIDYKSRAIGTLLRWSRAYAGVDLRQC